MIVPFEKIRTRKKAMKRIVDMLAEDAAKMPLEAAIIHANRPEEAEIWLAELSEQLPDVKFTISHFGPVIGTHLGEGSMGLGWVKRKGKRVAPKARGANKRLIYASSMCRATRGVGA